MRTFSNVISILLRNLLTALVISGGFLALLSPRWAEPYPFVFQHFWEELGVRAMIFEQSVPLSKPHNKSRAPTKSLTCPAVTIGFSGRI